MTLAIANNPATGTLGGTLVLPATGGVASFSNLTLDNTGVGYTLQATAAGLPSVTTSAISVLTSCRSLRSSVPHRSCADRRKRSRSMSLTRRPTSPPVLRSTSIGVTAPPCKP